MIAVPYNNNTMTSMITPPEAKWLLTETMKGSPRIKNPAQVLAHSEFIAEIVQDTVDKIRSTGIPFRINDNEMQSASLLHDIGYCFAENPYHHPHVGGDFLRLRGFPRIGKIIETHTYAPEAVMFIGYKGTNEINQWLPNTWNQLLIDYASLHAGQPGERITVDEKFKRFKSKRRDDTFIKLIDYAEGRLRSNLDSIEGLLDGNMDGYFDYDMLQIGGEFK